MESEQIDLLINEVIKRLETEGLISSQMQKNSARSTESNPGDKSKDPNQSFNINSGMGLQTISIDLDDPTKPVHRGKPLVDNSQDPEALLALMSTTTARIGVGRAGVRPKTESLLLFQSDFAVSQDALYKEVSQDLLKRMGLFTVNTLITEGKTEYLLRPDLGRSLSQEAKSILESKCIKNPNIQICVGDGLSASAIEANLEKIFPVLQSGCQIAGLSMGTSFFIQNCRVGVMNDIGDIIEPEVLILLIGERPGLGRADSMSAYMAYRPQKGHSDADREVICNIFDNGGTNPLEAGAYAIRLAQDMIKNKGSGVKMKMA
jgi:ethanolamine ammonia-lyase small subunit